VILCTGSDPALSAEDARAQGVTEYVLKPLMLHDLARTIRRVLDLPVPTPAQSGSGGTQPSPMLIEEDDAVSTRR